MLCSKCGKELPDNAAFCLHCGAAVTATDTNGQPREAETVRSAPAETLLVTGGAEIAPQPADNVGTTVFTASDGVGKTVFTAPGESDIGKTVANAGASSEKNEKPKSSSGKKVRKIFSVVISVLLTVTLISASALTVLRAMFTKENVIKRIDEADLSEIHLITNGREYSLPAYITEMNEYGWVANLTYAEKLERAKKFIGKPFVKKIINKVVEEYRSYFFDGQEIAGYDVNDIVTIIQENGADIKDAMVQYTGDPYIYLDYGQIRSDLNSTVGDMLTVRALLRDYGYIVEPVRFILSSTCVILLWVLSGVFIILLLILNMRDIGGFLLHVGIPTALLGVVMIAVGIAFGVVMDSVYISSANISLAPQRHDSFMLSCVALSETAIAIVTYCLLKKFKKNAPAEQ